MAKAGMLRKVLILVLVGLATISSSSSSIGSDIDPKYYEVFNNALKKNVNVLCYDCKFSNKGIEINKKIDLLNE